MEIPTFLGEKKRIGGGARSREIIDEAMSVWRALVRSGFRHYTRWEEVKGSPPESVGKRGEASAIARASGSHPRAEINTVRVVEERRRMHAGPLRRFTRLLSTYVSQPLFACSNKIF